MSTGKWTQEGVPHKGWKCVDIIDKGKKTHTCEMCEVMQVRYVHVMHHTDHPALAVGCICAGHMEEDLVSARTRETAFKNHQRRKAYWLKQRWYRVIKDSLDEPLKFDLKTKDGFTILVYDQGGTWGASITHRSTGYHRVSQLIYTTVEQAKLAAFDAMIGMKAKLEKPPP
jgi:hypothetical protein